MRLCIAICTRERPRLLRACLASVCAQAVPDGVSAEIVVVENHDRDVSRPIALEVAARVRCRQGLEAARVRVHSAARESETHEGGGVAEGCAPRRKLGLVHCPGRVFLNW